MFGFKKKADAAPQLKADGKIESPKSDLPEGCELLVACEFAEISGGTGGTPYRSVNL